ncbi:site-specific integrase [Phormidesmis priestleyi ULC007]|uniref:Site-specific integrase n=1 Tax=Phormidesmis priestleyi ULC007 TaxID=1920490 RepID=A0A2T1DJ64_9CYAN|nr:tyrosine-type recombinase/integrase [Phormidesmis priestleyi]PSB20549.1 site-specific integrase [Phormidesmis priestleyi ULC007]PZO54219.1 MAG: site-specific integrase [Phormidesmis priestleyi]
MKINRCGQAEALTKEMFQKVLGEIKNDSHRLIFALCWYTTERPSAILQLQVSDVYGSARVPLEKMVIAARTRKDKKTREVPIATALRQELKAYSAPSEGYLFPGRAGHLTFSAYDKGLRRVFEKLGLRGFSTYSTRRGSLTTLSRSGAGIRQIQALSGHASLGNLQRYIEVSDSEVAAIAAML